MAGHDPKTASKLSDKTEVMILTPACFALSCTEMDLLLPRSIRAQIKHVEHVLSVSFRQSLLYTHLPVLNAEVTGSGSTFSCRPRTFITSSFSKPQAQ